MMKQNIELTNIIGQVNQKKTQTMYNILKFLPHPYKFGNKNQSIYVFQCEICFLSETHWCLYPQFIKNISIMMERKKLESIPDTKQLLYCNI